MPGPSRTISTAFLVAVTVALAITARPDPQGALALSTATIQSDRLDYQPFTQVTLTGSGWLPGETVSMVFHEAGQTPDQYTDPDFVLTTVAHSDGSIYFADFWTDWHDVGITFTVTATGLTSGSTAQSSFTDAEAGDIDQCANGGNVKPYNMCAASDTWENGNLGQSDSHYNEGDSVSYRLRFSGLDPGAATHTVTIEWDSEKTTDHHAFDYLTTYNRTVTGAVPCAGVTGCQSLTPDHVSIPLDDHVTVGFDGIPGTSDDITQIAGEFYLWGGAITAISGYTHDYVSHDTPTRITLTFTASVSNPVLAWGGHIATRADWGLGASAIAISGSPYHMRFIELDGKGGNQDRSLSAEAVFYPGQLTIVKQTDPDAAPSQAFNYTTTGSFADSVGGSIAVDPSFTLTPPNGSTAVNRIFYLPDETARTVTESDPSPNFALSNLVCNQTSGGLGTGTVDTDLPTRTASITPKEGEFITCTYTNQLQVGSIKVVKATVPAGSSQNFSFTATGTGFAGSFSLTDGQDHTVGNLLTGTGYAVSETVPSGWDQTSATCDHGTITAIQVIANTTTTCTFTNTQRGSIVLVKDAVPNDPQDFVFAAGGGLSPTSVTLDDDSDATLPNNHTFADIAPGTYSLSETVPSGWDQTSAVCSDGSPVSAIVVSAGEVVTCTFTNTKRGSILLVKDAVPDDAQDFVFAAGGGLTPNSVTLDDDADATLPNSHTFTNLMPGTYSLSETVPTGWDQTSAVCSDASPVNAIVVSAGEQITCTFTNTKRGSITLVKDAVPNDAQDFAFTAGGGLTPTSVSLDDDADPTLSNTHQFQNVSPGTYSLAETAVAGWDLTSAVCDDGSPVNAIVVSPGEAVSCTFTNTKRGSITLVKNAIPDDPQDFLFAAGGGLTPTSVSLDDDADPTLPNSHEFLNVVPGTYSLSETVPTGWDQTSAVCSDGSPVTAIAVGAGEAVTCTFTNTKRGQIVVVKDAVPNDAQDFAFTTGGGLSPASFSLDDDADPTLSNTQTFSNVVPGNGYSVAETLPAGWIQTSATCSDGSPIGNIDVSAGETVTCTFVNTKKATLILKKVMIGGTATFAYTSAVTALNASIGVNEGTLTATVEPGSYTATESALAGWKLTGLSCVDATNNSSGVLSTGVATFNAAAGETITCTFTNTKLASLIVEKQTDPDGASGSFTFTGTAAGSIGDGGQIVVSNLDPGAYTSTEANPTPDFDLTSIVCSDANSTGNVSTRVATFNLEAGESVKCTFTNRQRGLAKVVKTFNGQALTGADSFTFQLRSGASASAAGTIIESLTANAGNGGVLNFTTKLVPGTTYQMCEQMQAGWLTTLGPPLYSVFNPSGDNSVVCTDFTVTAGQTLTFTINNQPPPGGMSLTIGYWKNWVSCANSNGKQLPMLDRTVNLKTLVYGSLTLTDGNASLNVASDCAALVNLLNKVTISGGKKMSSDPIFNMVAQLVAADVNVLAGAGLSVNAANAVNQAHALLVTVAFTGDGYKKPLSAANTALANCLATALDQSNNNKSVQSCQ